MKKNLLLLWLMLLTTCVSGFAQGPTTITIGTGTNESYNLPINNFYKNSWSEMIYPASDITESGYITSIGFDVSAVASGYQCNTITIYMGTTANEAHSSNSDWLPMDALTEVWSATDWPLPTTTGWLTFDLDNPFLYDGNDNLVIVISKTMPNYTSALKFRYTEGAANCCLYRRSDGNPDDYASHPGGNTGTLSAQLPNLQLTFSTTTDFCRSVRNLTVADITTSEATFSWAAPIGASFVLQYKTLDEEWEDDAVVTVYPSTTTYTLTNLPPNTHYNVRVANICVNEYSAWQNLSFKTECTSISVAETPYYESFEGYAEYSFPDCWTLISGYNNYPSVRNTTTTHSGSGELWLTCNSGNPIVMALPQFAEDLNTLRLSFWMQPGGTTNYYGRVELGVMTDLADTSTFTLLHSWSAVEIGSNTYAYYEMNLDTMVSSSTGFIVFRRYAEGTGTASYGWYLDDVQVMPIPACDSPRELFALAHAYSADLSWNDMSGTYNIYFKTDADGEYSSINNVEVTDTVYVLGNLEPSTTYQVYVAAICEDGSEVPSSFTITFTTLCDSKAPYSEDFNAGNTIPNCWEQLTGLVSEAFAGTAPVLNTSTGSYSKWVFNNTNVFGEYHPKVNIYGTNCKYWLVSPVIDLSGLDNPELAFDIALTAYNNSNPPSNIGEDDRFLVLISTDDGATWSADNAIEWNTTGTGDYSLNQIPAIGNEVTISLAQYAGQTIRIAFYGESTASGGDIDLHIDNVAVKEFPSCPRPTQLQAFNITTNSAIISWTEKGEASSWTVEYGPLGFGSGTVITITDEPATVLYGLTPSTDYEFRVAANCGETVSNSKSARFRTADCQTIALPFTEDFESYTASTIASTSIAPACWELVQEDAPMTDATRPQLYYNSTFAHSGNYSLKLHNRGVFAMPEMNIAMKDVKLEMYLRQANAAYQLEVGVWDDETQTFEAVQLFNNSSTGVEHVECDFSNYTGNGHRIAFHNVLASGKTWEYSYNYIDDITLNEIPLTPASLPYYTDFSEENGQNWRLKNGSCTNFWMMGSPDENTPSALFVTQDGATAGYNIQTSSTVMAEKAFFMPATDFVHVEFDVLMGGESTYDYLKVFLTPVDETFDVGTGHNAQSDKSYSANALDFSDYKALTTGNVNYPYLLNLTNGNTLHVSANLLNPNANGTAKIVFLWRNDNFGGTQPGTEVTNFSIEEIANEDMLPPTVTTDYIDNITTYSAVCHGNVTDKGNTSMIERGVCWSTTPNPTLEDAHTANGNGLGEFAGQLYNLQQGTIYYVRAYATNLAGTSYGEEMVFTTICEDLTLPYSDDFDSYTTDTSVATAIEPNCWELVQEDVPMTEENRPQLIYNNYAHSGDYSLWLKYRGIYAMPTLSENIAMNRMHLEMYLKQPDTCYALEVGVWEEDGTFVPVATFNNSTTDMEFVECDFSSYEGSGRRIAFHNIPGNGNTYNYSYNFIDDIVLKDVAMIPVDLPYSTNFGEDADRNWLLNNGSCTNYWTMGPTEYTSEALFVTQNGNSAGYNISNASTVTAEKAFFMPATDYVHVEFDVLAGGQSYLDYMKVFLTPVDETFNAGTGQSAQSSYTNSTHALNLSDYKSLTEYASYPYILNLTNGNILHISTSIENPAPNGTGKIVFLWRNNQSQGTQPGAVITNFSIDEAVVLPPSVTTGDISDVTANTATCGGNVTDNGGLTVTERGVCWSTSPNPTLENAHTVDGSGLGEFISNLTNLSLGVTYYIRAYATNDAGTGYGEEISFSACDPITQLPYTEDFESYTESTTAATGIAPICWELVQEDVAFTDATRPQLYYKNAFAHSGDYSLLLNYRGVYAMPALSENITMKFMRLKMYLRQPNAAYRLQVGVWDDETSTFTPVATFNNSTTEVEYVECDFSNYTGNGRRIAFRNILGSGNYAYSYNYIDDIALTETAPAFSYTTENVCNSVSVHFENNSTEAENAAWDFGDGTTSEEFAPTHTYQESGTYVVTLSVNNGVCEEWLSVTQNVTVTMPETFTISIPYSDNFDSYTADTNTATGVEPSCWELVQEDVTMTDENRPQLIHNSNYTHSGDYSLQLNYRGIYAMPPLSDDLMLKHVKLEMYLKQPNSYYALEVGVWEDDGTFVPVATFNNSTTDMKHVECDFSIYEGSGRRIAFHNIPVGDNIYDYSYNFIDDLVLTESEGCELTIEMHDLYNDGWTGNKIRIHNDGTEKEVTLNSGSAATATVRVHSGHIALEWVNGQYPNDCSFTVTGPCLYYQAETVPAAGVFYEIDLDCNSNGTPAIPAFTWWTENTCNSVLVHFVNESSDAEFADWDFGDGDWSNEYAPVHEYTSDGTYPVMLSVNNSTCVNVINETNHVTVTMPEPLAGDTTEFIICYGDFPQFWTNNLEINGPGIYTTVIEAANGCDSIVTCSVSVTNPITIPYSEDFESYTESSTAATGIEPTCWNLVQQDVQMPDNKRPQLYYRSDFAHSGDYSLLLNYRGIYAMPPLEENMAMKHVHLDMYLRQPNAAYQLEVGVWDDETGTFEPIATFNNSTTGVEHVECDFSNYTGNGRHIAFHNVLGSGNYAYSYNYIDDIVLTESEGCATLTFEMHDAYGDGWNGNTIRVYNDGIMKDVTLEDGADGTVTVQVYNGPIELEWIFGSKPEECTFSVSGPCLYYSSDGTSQDGIFLSKEIDCNNNSIPAVPAFSYWTENTCNSVLVHFENESTNAENVYWTFGDGTSSEEYSPTHEYLSSGTYGVELYVSNSACDDWYSIVQYVEVTVPESITHTFDTTVCANQLPLIWHGHEIAKEGVFTNVSMAANGCDSTVILTLNVSDLTAYTTGAIYYTQPTSEERLVTVSDYNDDGLEDLVTRIHPSGEIRFYQNTGASMEYDYSLYAQAYAFSAAFDECNNGQSNALSCFTDFDNDGVTDFLVYSANHYNCGSNAVRIYWGSATHPYFNDNDFTELAINGPYCVGAYSADLNNDGLADVLIRNCGPTNLYMNEGNRIFTQTNVFNTGRDINVIFDDYDLDGNVDLCYTKNGWADGQWGIRINFGNGDGTFNSSTVSAFDYLQPLDGFLNFNANPLDDNVPDIAFTCNGENNSKVYIGELNTDGFEGDFLAVDASDETRIVQAFDIDNNGFEDLIIRLKTGDNYSAKAYLNDGHGNFAYNTIPVLGNSPYYPYKFWREGERILMATYHGVDRDSIVVFELKAITCESLCATLVTLPYSEDFDTYTISTTAATGVEPRCWELVQEDVEMTDANRPQLYYKSEFAHSGNYSLKLHNRGVYAMPPLDENMAMKHVHLEMYLRQPNAAYQLQVGVWDDETSTFTPVDTFNNNTTEVEFVECDFSNYTGNGRRIAFRNTLGNGKTWSYSYNYLDDISLTETEGCELTVENREWWEGGSKIRIHNDGSVKEVSFENEWGGTKTVTIHSGPIELEWMNGYYPYDCNFTITGPSCIYYSGTAPEEEGVFLSSEIDCNNNGVQAIPNDISYWTESTCNGVLVHFDNVSNNAENAVWDFGDGTTSEELAPTHEYTESGDYHVTVSVNNNECENWNSMDYYIWVDMPEPVIVTLPYSEDFESYTESSTAFTGIEPKCWELVQQDVDMPDAKKPQLYYKSDFAHSGDYSLLLNYQGVYAMPPLNENMAMKHVRMEMYLRQPKAPYQLEVGVWDDETSTFTPVASFNNSTTEVEHVECDFSNYTGSGRRIAFRNVLGSGNYAYSYNYIDDIVLTETEGCATLTFKMHDSYGDGWNGNTIRVHTDGTVKDVTLEDGADGTATVQVYNGLIELEWIYGGWPEECSFSVTGPCLYYSGGTPVESVFLNTEIDCNNSGITAIPDFTYWTENTCNSVIVHFENNSSDAESATWDFGDGAVSEEFAPIHEYTINGNYHVTLSVNNSECGNLTNSIVLGVDVVIPEPIITICDTVINAEAMPIVWHEQEFSVEGSYSFVFTAANGCDSTVTISVWVIPFNDAQPCLGHETVTDIDGNVYNTVKIGEQCWMKENLRVTHYADETEIPLRTFSTLSNTTPYRYSPDDNEGNVDTYGYLYNWAAVMHGMSSSNANPSNVQGVCPTGWHMPSDAEWEQLIDYVSNVSAYFCNGDPNSISKALASTFGWADSWDGCSPGTNQNTNDITGFNARPAGGNGGFSQGFYVWSTSLYDNSIAIGRDMYYNSETFVQDLNSLLDTRTVRCVLGEGYNLAAVTTGEVNAVSYTSATCGGNVTYDGNTEVTARGICWGTEPNPTLENDHTVDGNGTGAFTGTLTGLIPGTTYYVRAYATNNMGTAYGNEMAFTTCGYISLPYTEDFESYITATPTVVLYEDFSAITDSNSYTITNSLDAYTQLSGWSGDWVYPSNGKVKIGKSSMNGYLQTPALNLSGNNGEFVVTFDAKAWPNDTTSLIVAINEVPYTVDGLSTSEFNTFSVPLTGGTSTTVIKFQGVQESHGRFFLDNVVVTSQFINADNNLTDSNNADSTTFPATTGIEPDCWTLVQEDVPMLDTTRPQLYYNSAFAHSGNSSLRLCNRGIYAMQSIEEDMPMRHVHLEMYLQQPDTAFQLEVGVWDDETSSFETVAMFNNSTTEMEFVACDFSEYTGNGHRIAFRNLNSNGDAYSYNYLDDIVLTETEGCTLTIENHSPSWEWGGGAKILVHTDGCVKEVTFENSEGEDGTATVTVYNGSLELEWVNGGYYGSCYFTVTGPSCLYYSGYPEPGIFLSTEIDCNNDDIPAVPAFSWWTESTCNSVMVHFENNSANAENAVWDFGDGTSSEEFAPIHEYTADGYGNYDVTLSVNNDACEDWHSLTNDMFFGMPEPIVITLHYTEDFESYTESTTVSTGVKPRCWDLVQEDVTMTDTTRPQLYYDSTFAHSGDYSLKLHDRGIYAMPPIKENLVMKHVHLEMFLRQPNADYQLEVGVWDEETNTFDPIATFNNSTSEVEYVECDFSNYTGNGHRIAFHNILDGDATYNHSYNYIDDITLDVQDGVPCLGTPTVTDHEGNIYNTVQIGNQCWTKENLRTSTSPSTGTNLISASDADYSYTGKQAHWYDNDAETYAPQNYGLLYNWNAAVDTFNTWYGETSVDTNSNNSVSIIYTGYLRGICPVGWHLPSDAEWTQLINYVENVPEYQCREIYIAKALASTIGWDTSFNLCSIGNNQSANNAANFCAVPAGCCTGSSFDAAGYFAPFWCATQYNSKDAFYYSITTWDSRMYSYSRNKNYGYSVRCILNDTNIANELNILTVTTDMITNVTLSSATCGGNITSDGGADVTERGVCWSTAPHPTIYNNHTVDGNGTGAFTSSITDLEQGITYFVRAYATNSVGTEYGEEVSFTTLAIPDGDAQPCAGTPIVTDVDGNVYNTVKIGKQCWMRENLRVTHYADSTLIPEGGDSTSYTKPYYYVNPNVNAAVYGYYYNWTAAMHLAPSSDANPSGVQGICPDGWHLPSETEWIQLTDHLNSVPAYLCNGEIDRVAKALASTEDWESNDYDCSVGNEQTLNNTSGFSAIPAGGYYGSSPGFFNDEYGTAVFWSSTEMNGEVARNRGIIGEFDIIAYYNNGKSIGYPVRCLRNNTLAFVNTKTVIYITSYSAKGRGFIIDDGGEEITARGICWSTHPNPTLDDNHTEESTGTGTGAFASLLTGLDQNTTYYVRAYATNSMGTTYGNEVSFTTTLASPAEDAQPCPGHETLTDYDGNIYNTVKIGEQCWMKENLRVTHYSNGEEIPADLFINNIYSTSPSRYTPGNNMSNVHDFGYLYNWAAVMHGASSSSANPSNVQGACPDGWHVPSEAEWVQLIDYVGSILAYRCDGDSNNTAKALASTEGWFSTEDYYDTENDDYDFSEDCNAGSYHIANNASGFSALPARAWYLGTASYSGIGDIGGSNYFETIFWSSSDNGTSAAACLLADYSNIVFQDYWDKIMAASVRCLRDEPELSNRDEVTEEPSTTPISDDLATESADINSPLGIEESANALESIVIYPNPTRDFINVQWTMNNVQCSGVEVIDVYGKVVRTVVGANNDSSTQINVSDLAAGMYFVRVTTEEGTVTKPFVKR